MPAIQQGDLSPLPELRLLPESASATSSGRNEDPGAESRAGGIRWLLTSTALSWYLSLAIHTAAYVAGAALFGWLGLLLIAERPDVTPLQTIRASLDDTTVDDDAPALQIVEIGPVNEESEASLQQQVNLLQTSENGFVDTVVTDAKIAVTGSAEAKATDAGGSPFFREPESGFAVTKGSFTAWTDPAQPGPGDPYQIIIEIRLPDDVKKYRLSDLSGRVVGTDRYRQRIPYDSRSPGAARVTGGANPVTVRSRTIVKVSGNKLQLAIRVPGASRLVKDRIQIRSRKLREEQELELVFGQGEKLGLGFDDD